ncbi:MAG: ABC-F family ATP-binding cassette domain-containing protein [Thermodesulfobacteriota bacterium]|nr:ABC-F family ATP-binding cassette domain-containing protein [Thermodesulfobacteriota bacterium]
MSLITVVKVSLSFSGKQIFNEIGFQIDPRGRIGLVGSNGSGKTTLLRLIMGEISPDSGEVILTKGTRIGYLPQDVQETLSGPLLQSVIESIPGRSELKSKLSSANIYLKEVLCKRDQIRIAKELGQIHQEINRLGLEYPRHGAEKILLGLGFTISDFDRPVSSLSGGWKMRAALASLLYQRPDLLLLDEPTNHLDIPSVHWLEQFLQDFAGAIILVSHDRDFLNRQINSIIGFGPEGMRSYNGDYDFYLKAREEERRTLEAKARKQEQRVKEAEKFIERFRAKASKARQAQSKIKVLKKMELIKTHRKEKVTHFSFPNVPRSGRVVVSIKGLSKRFDELPLYRDINLNVIQGERIAIIGPNGCGKTTLLRMVAGEIKPDQGMISLGHAVSISYFAQHHSDILNHQKTVIEEVHQVASDENIGFVRGVCGAFLFSGQDVDKTIGVLSGGERARVSLAKLLIKPGNLMVMDEPTNHLDISSSEALIDALCEYNGTLLFVSHNQSFVNRLATKIWDIREGEIIEYPGNLDEYYYHIAKAQKESSNNYSVTILHTKEVGKKTLTRKGHDRKKVKKQKAEKRQLIYNTLKPILDEVDRLEGRIAELESKQKEIETLLANPEIYSDSDRYVTLIGEYNSLRKILDEFLLEWEQTQTKLETTREELEVDDH